MQDDADADTDGLPDAWEVQHFGDTTPTAAGDFDRDGFSNLEELANATNPANPNSIPGDLDGDNLPDDWEMQAFGSLAPWAYDDADADGYHNLGEMVAGTQPRDPASHPQWSPPHVELLNNVIVDTNALCMPTGSIYGRNMNGVSFQADILLTSNGYQYTGWYDTVGTTQTMWLGRRTARGASVGAWEHLNTGSSLANGGEPEWDAHNSISLGICPQDGTLHVSWDHHGDVLRYRRSQPGLCTTNATAWGTAALQDEQDWLADASQPIARLTYPIFFNSPAGELFFSYRVSVAGGGIHWMTRYHPDSGRWETPWPFTSSVGTFAGVSNLGNVVTSVQRFAYENGFDFGLDGTLHYTWTLREFSSAFNFNHDIHYASSTDGGVSWFNNQGTRIANARRTEPITLQSPGIIVKPVEGTQQMINQQSQCVDAEGRVHVVMYHRRVEPGFEWQPGDDAFGGAETAYYHYFRDPVTRVWSQRRLPTTHPCGSRPKIAFDWQSNVYVVFNIGRLIVASASHASEYTDWAIVAEVPGGFMGEPLLDQSRLLADGVLSVILQENGPPSSVPLGTPLHVVEFALSVPPAPARVAHFRALSLSIAQVQLTWATLAEHGLRGFHLDRRITDQAWTRLTPQMIPASGDDQKPGEYGWQDLAAPPGYRQVYRLVGVDSSGQEKVLAQARVPAALLASMTLVGPSVRLNLQSAPGDAVVVESAANVHGPWSVLGTLRLDEGDTTAVYLPFEPGEPARFYRAAEDLGPGFRW